MLNRPTHDRVLPGEDQAAVVRRIAGGGPHQRSIERSAKARLRRKASHPGSGARLPEGRAEPGVLWTGNRSCLPELAANAIQECSVEAMEGDVKRAECATQSLGDLGI